MRRIGLQSIGLIICTSAVATAAEAPDYTRDIKPLLQARCYACHGALKQNSSLRLDTGDFIRKGSKNGPIVTPGKADKSRLISRITSTLEDDRMPPEGEPLTPSQIALIRQWITAGAKSPAGEKAEIDPLNHWAFRAPLRPTLPKPAQANWARNPIDQFIAAEHTKHGLKPQPPADKGTLLRRVYIDLTGLPPTHAELTAFIADTSVDAYEKIVDRLLASPQHSERWARHWMDLWRYSDWWGLGAEMRNSHKHIWHWRDWIMDSLQADKGYDQMIREMIAADELYPEDLDRIRATGYLARQYFKFNRNSWLEETVEHTSKAFLGITLNCNKCHDHKYDPFTQADFYRFRAIFEPYQVRADQLPGETDYEKNGLPRAFDCNLDAPTFLFIRGDEKNPAKDKIIPPGVPEVLALGGFKIQPITLPPTAHQPGLRPFILENLLRDNDRQVTTSRVALAQAQAALKEAQSANRTHLPAATNATILIHQPSPLSQKLAGKILLEDLFDAAKPDLWKKVSGDWQYSGGRLLQKSDGDVMRGILQTKSPPPADFEARFKFIITGGKMWRSVGINFDIADTNEVLVYVSATTGGPKVQIAYKQGASYVYPNDASLALPIKVGAPHEIHLRVRDTLINVAVDGKHALAWRLPIARKPGQLELITFDAQAAFTGFQLAELPKEIALATTTTAPTAPIMKAGPLTIAQATAAVRLAEKTVARFEAIPNQLRARHAASIAQFALPSPADAKELARAAAKAEKLGEVFRLEEELARAELEQARTDPAKKPDTEKKIATAKSALDLARKAAETPSESFTAPKGSLKTLESNLESEASRSKPFPLTSTGRRSALAAWMTDPTNPLTARVAVNHIWARHIGQPLVPTVFDFGRKGTAPTHPELLDWLAVEFRENGWSMRHLHRLIVTSATYRMTSSSAGNVSTVDPENRLLWRMASRRMESEVVRDSLLQLAGILDTTRGGPPVKDDGSRRRALYFVHSHNEHNKFLTMFDNANVLECYRREESIVPQQALVLANSKLALDTAQAIASKLSNVGNEAAFIVTAFETVLSTTPTLNEQAECAKAMAAWRELAIAHQLPQAESRARTNLIHAFLNHNDFIIVR